MFASPSQTFSHCAWITWTKDRLERVKESIRENHPYFTAAYQQLITAANKELTRMPDPVTNRSQLPPRFDRHDYLSIAPYRWPNPDTADGFSWIVKEGEINPMSQYG